MVNELLADIRLDPPISVVSLSHEHWINLRRKIVRLAEPSNILSLAVFRQNRGEFTRFPDLGSLPVEHVDGYYDQARQACKCCRSQLRGSGLAEVVVQRRSVHCGYTGEEVSCEGIATCDKSEFLT